MLLYEQARPARTTAVIVATVAGVIAIAAAGLFLYQRVEPGDSPTAAPDSAAPGAAAFAAPGAGKGRNLLLVTLDAVRPERLGCYGFAQARTPTIDRLAAEGVRFDQAVTAAPISLPAHCTILTGLYPPAHGVRDDGAYRLVSEQVTLVEMLREQGYTTAAFVSAFALDSRAGLRQGFDHYDDALILRFRGPASQSLDPERPANLTIDAALAWLKAHREAGAARPFFLWVHLVDPHLPYLPPPDIGREFGNRLYDAEITFADRELGRLIAGLREHAFADNTLTTVVGTSGEALGEHGELTHGHMLYNSTTRVPLILHGPQVIEPGRVVADVLAGGVDVTPTLLDLVGIAVPPECQGRSLLAPPQPGRALYMETLLPMLDEGWAPLYAARTLSAKYIEAPAPEFYDLAADPREINNLWPSRPPAATELAAELERMRSASARPPAGAVRSLDADALAEIVQLGYVAPGAASRPSERPDPKTMTQSLQERMAARNLLQAGRAREAVEKLEALTSASPGSAELWLLLAQALENGRGPAVAIEAARNAVSADPSNPELWCALAAYQYALGNAAAGQECLARAERIDPNHGRVWLLRAWAAIRDNDLPEAMKLAQRAAQVDPSRVGGEALSLIAGLHEHNGEKDQARAAYETALNLDPMNAAALLGRAKIALNDKEMELAAMLLQNVPEWQPQFIEAGKILGWLFYQGQQPDAAAHFYARVLANAPRDGQAHYELARVRASQGHADEAIGHLQAALELGRIDFQMLRTDPGFAPLLDDPRLAELQAQAATEPPPHQHP